MSQYEIPSAYDDAISNRERRSLRAQSPTKRRDAARNAQNASGIRIRIWRPVKNQADFKSELKVWREPVQAGIATRKSLGSFAMTIFDTSQQPLRYCRDYNQDELESLLHEKCPKLFDVSPPIEVTGVNYFGDIKDKPSIALTLAAGYVYAEKKRTWRVVAPELSLDDSHQLDHRPHVTLGTVLLPRQAEGVRSRLTPLIPGYVQFNPARLSVTDIQSGETL